MIIGSKFWEEVDEGQELPSLEFPITIKTLILGVAGTRDFQSFHHNREYAKSAGSRDMFVNTMFDQALFGRFVTDWSGPDSDFRSATLQMGVQVCPDDVLRVEGSVVKKYEQDGDYRIDISMTASNHIGVAARSSATIAMPSRAGGEVKPKTAVSRPEVSVHPEMPEFARKLLGRPSRRVYGAYPMSVAQIMYWCDMVEDGNPTYVEGEYASRSRRKGVIAPPMGLITYALGRPGQLPDVNNPEHAPWPPDEAADGDLFFTPPNTREIIAVDCKQEYGVPVRPGDRISSSNELLNCSPLKRTHLGRGYFQTVFTTYYNQREEIVGTNLYTLLRYGLIDEQGG
jgi:acyl dehydratase